MARVPCDPVERKPPFGYRCHDGEDPTVEPYYSIDGIPVVQGPVNYCGTDDPVCEGDSVSGCISDTDGAPTTYGPAPVAPAPADVAGNSPRFSRVRVNRTSLPPLPYSSQRRPDQLLDIVIDDGDGGTEEVPWNPSTGRFTLPPYPSDPPDPIVPETYHRAVVVSEILETDAVAEGIRVESPIETIVNPSSTLSMSVVVHCTVQVGLAIVPEGQVVVAPQQHFDSIWLPATWQETTFPNKSEDGITGGVSIHFVDHFVLAPLGTRSFKLGVTAFDVTPGSLFGMTPVSLHMMCVGDNYDT